LAERGPASPEAHSRDPHPGEHCAILLRAVKGGGELLYMYGEGCSEAGPSRAVKGERELLYGEGLPEAGQARF
jgi:hypothetical protein